MEILKILIAPPVSRRLLWTVPLFKINNFLENLCNLFSNQLIGSKGHSILIYKRVIVMYFYDLNINENQNLKENLGFRISITNTNRMPSVLNEIIENFTQFADIEIRVALVSWHLFSDDCKQTKRLKFLVENHFI